MRTSFNIENNNVAFSASLARNFQKAADNYLYRNINTPIRKLDQFIAARKRFENLRNTENITIDFRRITDGTKKSYELFAKNSDTNEEVILSKKDTFRKIIDKFSFMNDYEFKVKMGLLPKE